MRFLSRRFPLRRLPRVLRARHAVWLLFCLLAAAPVAAADSSEPDSVEFLNGSTLTGTVSNIRVADKEFEFESKIGTRTLKRTYRFDEVHAVTMQGKRYVLTDMPAQAEVADAAATERTRSQVRQLIQAAAKEPEWMPATPVNAPASLDLAWPETPPKGWNNQVNVGQYIWDVINPNPNRWRSGVKLIHQIMETHRAPALLARDRQTLGRMYFELLQDYPRAAYWIEQAQPGAADGLNVKLAECYWRLGNREMALELLKQPRLPIGAIKLLGELGEVDRALRLAAAFEGSNAENNARLLAADLLRSEGRLDEAISLYEKALNSDSYRNAEYEKRSKGQARDSIEAIRLFDAADIAQVADGKYRSDSVGYNGPVEIEVNVAGGKIQSLTVVQHREKQFYSALEDTPRQIMQRQTVRDVDGFSGATITSNAIVNATAKALAKGSQR